MNIWGKLGGAGFGALIGGPIGALIGGVAGHFAVDREGAPFGRPSPDLIFATGLIALSAKMAKADGVVTQDEIAAFREIIDVSDADMPHVTRLFDLARQTTDGFEAYAAQIARAFAGNDDLLESVLDGLFMIAKADRAIHEREYAYLEAVALQFGFTEERFARIAARHVARADDPYAVLGADPNMDDSALKSLYRRLVAETHPDRLIAKGLPPEAIRIATARLAAINAAWETISRARSSMQTPASA